MSPNVTTVYNKKRPVSAIIGKYEAFKGVCPRRFELPTSWSVARRSIQLSHGHINAVKISEH